MPAERRSTKEGQYLVMWTSKVRYNYFFHGSRSQQYIQAGNAVLPYLFVPNRTRRMEDTGLSRTNRKKTPGSSLSAFRSKARARPWYILETSSGRCTGLRT